MKSSLGPNWSGLTKTEATTNGACLRASRTSERCPSCSAPIVGTKRDEPFRGARLADGAPQGVDGADGDHEGIIAYHRA